MILYFSSTGNCKYIATRIAQELNDIAVSICDITYEQKETLKTENIIGIVTPTYVYKFPIFTEEFLKNTKFSDTAYKFIIAAYGTSPGTTWYLVDKYAKKTSDTTFDIKLSIMTNDNYTPLFDLSDQEKVNRINHRTDEELNIIIEKLKAQEKGNYMVRKLPPIALPFLKPAYNYMRKTNHLKVEDSCIGCGLCAAKCPAKAIEMKDNKPVWTEKKCAMCLGCLHRCPKFSIYYGSGRASKKHGQYQNPNVKI